MAKKLFTISSLLIIASILLAACGGGSAATTAPDAEEPAGDKVLRLWIQWGDNPQQIQVQFLQCHDR